MNNELASKSILVVGANGALAKETIKALIQDGAKRITMACRSESNGIEARKEILLATSSKTEINISVVGGFDMNAPQKIEKAIVSLGAGEPFDIVFLAAGFAVFADDYQTIEWNGKIIEKNIFQNMLGNHLTFAALKNNNLIAKGARVVLAGGEGARGIKGMIEAPYFSSPKEFSDYVYLKKTPKYNPMNAIGVSKLCGAFWTTKIAALEAGNMDVIWFSPGLTYGSAGLKTLPPVKRWFMNNIMFGILSLLGQAQSPQEGGRKFADCLEGKVGGNGGLLGAPAGKTIGKISDQTSMNTAFSNEALINEFWNILEEVCGLYKS